MAEKSGQFVIHVNIPEVECGVCDYEGETEGWIDTHDNTYGWECPECGEQHEDDMEYPDDEVDDDWEE